MHFMLLAVLFAGIDHGSTQIGAADLVPLPFVVCVQIARQAAPHFDGFYAEQGPAEARAQQIGTVGWDDRSPASPKRFRFIPVFQLSEVWVEDFVEGSPCLTSVSPTNQPR